MKYLIIFALFIISACSPSSTAIQDSVGEVKAEINGETLSDTLKKVVKTDSEWKEELSEMEYYVLRKAGTERAFTGDLLNNKEKGIYICRGCGFDLFDSNSKFKSGTGWPSFYEPIKKGQIDEDTDYNIGYARTEILCARCGGHLGHVFKDGPKPTGLRYCVNSVSLDFKPQKED